MDRPHDRGSFTFESLKNVVATSDLIRAMTQLDSESPEPSPFIWERIQPGWVMVQTSDGTLGMLSELWLWHGIRPQPYNDKH